MVDEGEGEGEEKCPDKTLSKAVVGSLQVNVVSDQPIAAGVRWVERSAVQFSVVMNVM